MMDWQQIVTLTLAAVAGVYLGRSAWRSIRAALSGKGGCESGCGKCGFAPPERNRAPAPGGKPSNVIALTDIRKSTKS